MLGAGSGLARFGSRPASSLINVSALFESMLKVYG